MLRGVGFHVGAATNMTQKIESREDLPADDIVDAAVAGFETGAAGGYILGENETEKDVGGAKDSLVEMTACHAAEQAPEYQPVLVEHRVRIALPGARDLVGILDLADDQGRVVDFKTSGRRKSQAEADDSVQLTVYAATYKAVTSHQPRSLRMDSIVRTKGGSVYREALDTTRDDADFAALANRINTVSAAIDAGSFPPATPGAWWCSNSYCGYWRSCPYVNSERKAKSHG